MANKFRLRILTPARELMDREVDMVVFRTLEGDMAVLAGHASLTCVLTSSAMKITDGEEELHAAVMSGFAEIHPDRVTIMSDAAEWPDEIDIHRAEDARERAKRRLEKSAEADVDRAKLAMRRALVRLEVSGYKPKDNQN